MRVLTVFFLTSVLFIPFHQSYNPISFECRRKRGNLWWEYDTTGYRCETLDNVVSNEECGICGRPCFRCFVGDANYPDPGCYHKLFSWRYDFEQPYFGESRTGQICKTMNHCRRSYKLNRTLALQICGLYEKRGTCQSVYGTYICECKKPYQGRDCGDLGQENSYARGIQVMVDHIVNVSTPLSILVAVKHKGIGFKVYVKLFNINVTITITTPSLSDPSSARLIALCMSNTHLKEDCARYLQGSTLIYSTVLRFPLIRSEQRTWYYNHTRQKQYPIGYEVDYEITATNFIDGSEKLVFYRHPIVKNYTVFVNYPIDITCYKNVKIENCEGLKKRVNLYRASEELVVYGRIVDTPSFPEVVSSDKLDCKTSGGETVKWTLLKFRSDGSFFTLEESKKGIIHKFVIGPYKLREGFYKLVFSYKMLTKYDIRENFDECYINVVEEPLRAIIYGGRFRSIDYNSELVLDGRQSYDPSRPGKEGKIGLTFYWTCTTDKVRQQCLNDSLPTRFGSKNYIKIQPSALEPNKEYLIELHVSKEGKAPAYTKQTVFIVTAGIDLHVTCINCMEGSIANPNEYIYLFANAVMKKKERSENSLHYSWTYSTDLVDPPTNSTDGIRVNGTSENLLKIDENKLDYSKTYVFRVTVSEKGKDLIQAFIEITTPPLQFLACSLSPDSGIVAKTNFSYNCSKDDTLTYEIYDKPVSDLDLFSGRMLFAGLHSVKDFLLANGKFVVYSYNNFKVIRDWVQEVKLTPFDGKSEEIEEMINELYLITDSQRLLHSSSIIPAVVEPGMNWSSIVKTLISTVYGEKIEAQQDIKLVLSSIHFILETSKKETNLTLGVEEAYMCADMIFEIAWKLYEHFKEFENIATITKTILIQIIRSILNIIETVLSVRDAKVLAKPLHLVNPYTLRLVKETTNKLVDVLYKVGRTLLWSQVFGDTATKICSFELKISEWVMVHSPEIMYGLRSHNQDIPFNFSFGLYKTIKSLHSFGIQVTNLNVNPFWWAGGDINTNILLLDVCIKVSPTQCTDKKILFTAPILLFFNISGSVKLVKPLKLNTVQLNLSKSAHDLDLDITVYRFDPPMRAKLFIQFQFIDPSEQFRVLFKVNERPDYNMMMTYGKVINSYNQSLVKYLNYYKKDSDNLYYMGIIPATKSKVGRQFNFNLKIYYIVCKTWLKWKWGSQRCWVGEEETNENTLRCDCNHLSMFAGSVQIPQYSLNPSMEFLLFLTIEFNWLPLAVLCFIWLLLLLLFVWGWRADYKDSKKGIVNVLEDNFPGESYGYLIGVFTGSRINAGTNANVGIKLIGVNDESRPHVLRSKDQRILRGNSDDWFLIYTPKNLGTLERLHVWHDNSGKSPDWFVEKIEVTDLSDKFTYIFELNTWLALEVDEYPEAIVATSSLADFFSVKKVFVGNVITGLRDTQYWTSIFWKHPRNPIKRVQRIGVVFCYIMTAMCVTTIVYKFNQGEYNEDDPAYDLDSTDLVVFSITVLLSSFPSCFVMFLFRKSFSHMYMRQRSSLFLRPEDFKRRGTFYTSNQQELFSDINVNKNMEKLSMVSVISSSSLKYLEFSDSDMKERFIRFGVRSKQQRDTTTFERLAAAIHAVVRGSTIEPVRLPKYTKTVTLHRKYYFAAWSLCIIIMVLTFGVVITYGNQIPRVVSERCLTIFLCVICFEAVILSTFKILLCSTILACAFQRLVPVSNYQVRAKDGIQKNLIGKIGHLYNILKLRSQPMYCPLQKKHLEIEREKRIKKEQFKLLVEFLVVLMFILVLVMLTELFTAQVFRTNSHVERMISQGYYLKYPNFTSVFNRTHYLDFLANNFVDQLHRYLWYNQEDPLNDNAKLGRNSWTYDCTMRLLGNVRIRQLRVIVGKCTKIRYFEEMQEYCSPTWSSNVEDTGTYGTGWRIGGYEDVIRKSNAWRHMDASYSNSSISYGRTLTLYPAGGFVEDLGYDKDFTEDVLSSLLPNDWVDHMTRAVFIELTLFNVNTGLFSQAILVAEQMPTGEFLVEVKTESVTTDFNFHFWNISFGVFLIFFLVRMFVLMNRRGIFHYLSKVFNLFEVFLLGLGLLTLIFYVVHIMSSSNYIQQFQRSGIDEFFSFFIIVSYRFLSRTVLFTLCLCVILRMLFSWRFGRIYFTFYYTFLLSCQWIVWLLMCLILYLVIFRRLVGYLLNVFIFPYYTTVNIYFKDFFACDSDIYACGEESFLFNVFVYSMCLPSYVIILLFISSFTYYYKVAEAHKLIDTDNLNYFMLLNERITNKMNKCKKIN